MVFVEILKSICIFFDWIIYSITELCYVLFAVMCQMNLQALGDSFTSLVGRIKLFIGVLILFVVAFNLLKMLIEPDTLEKTSSELVKKVAISILLLISSSFIFQTLDDFQTKILEENVIENIILGTSGEETYTGLEKYVATGKFFSYNLLFSFVTVDDNVKYSIMGTDPEGNALPGGPTESLWHVVEVINDKGVTYQFPIISGAVGILMAVIFVIFAIDIGVRSFTLVLLQVISPIPIIMYLTPNGKSMLNKFIQTYISVYIELFSKIIISYLVLYLMQFSMKSILNGVASEGVGLLFNNIEGTGPFFRVMLLVLVIVALFMFARNFPKMLSNILGINFGGTSFNPFKITGSILKTGAHLGGAVVGASIGGVVGGIAAKKVEGASAEDVARGAFRGLGQGAQNGYRVNGIRSAFQAATTGNRDNYRTQRQYVADRTAQGGSSGIRAQRANQDNERRITEARRKIELMDQFEGRRTNALTASEASSFNQHFTGTRQLADGTNRTINYGVARNREEYVAAMTQNDRESLEHMQNNGYSLSDIQAQRARLEETERLANEDVNYARDYIFTSEATDATTDAGMQVLEADNLVRANQDVFQRSGVSGATGMNSLHDDIRNPGVGLRSEQNQIIADSSTNATARAANAARARGAANASRNNANNNGSGGNH